ncbi:hypothetical protein [Kitasatospora sp. NPDC091276]|uniref:hypothetical protein n=1 Tax=Kitasatospora sp. NPDC091276 TaxID=3155300 RepID=UPI00342617A2
MPGAAHRPTRGGHDEDPGKRVTARIPLGRLGGDGGGAVCVRLFVMAGGSGPPDCFPSGGAPAGSSPPARVTSVPAGTPHPPEPTGPADRTVIELGQSVTLSWGHAAAMSRVFTGLGDDAPAAPPG